jgi:8-oxo-dGTP diphosphatase
MNTEIREFGTPVAEAEYHLRPGGYSVIRRTNGEVAVVTTPGGCFLPGGGREADETFEQAAIREAREECGLQIEIVGHIGVADELDYSEEERKHFRKRCTFFLAAVKAENFPPMEADHKLLWISTNDAATRLSHGSQRWAVAEACRRYSAR